MQYSLKSVKINEHGQNKPHNMPLHAMADPLFGVFKHRETDPLFRAIKQLLRAALRMMLIIVAMY